ncbi:MAG: sialate O-acetylesterase [Flammeovirgaceae bacterium]|nr:sialate O-acetylesterase [Flammeovirgaceae bacterium]MBE60896.1 sialate O-acetylesterase [Flammeovirgaceae bacterium]
MSYFRSLLSIVAFSLTIQLSTAQDPNLYIFLCFGQSNMEGQGTIGFEDQTVDERFQVYQALDCSNLNREKGKWYPAVPPLTRCWTRLSPADYFGRTMVENLPEHIKVGVINVSVGGCRLELFDKDIYQNYTNTFSDDWFQDIIADYEGNPYQYLLDLAKEAQKDGVIKGILLHQGESNNGDSQWPTKVKKIYEDLIIDLELDATKTPLLAGEMVNADQGGLLAGMNTIINQLPDVLDNSYVISSSECSDQSDNIHFDAAGYRELGRRYAEKMLEVMDYTSTILSELPANVDGIQLHSTYPNPAKDVTNVSFTLNRPMEISLNVQDLSGRQVRIITSKSYDLGSHTIQIDLSGLESGVYFYSMITDQSIITRKLIKK